MIKKADRRTYVKYVAAGVVVVALVGIGAYYLTAPLPSRTSTPTLTSATELSVVTPTAGPGIFALRSDDFEDNGEIPPRFTCDGENISPQLSWENPPEGTKSFAISATDLDAPGGIFVHWLVYDVPSHVRELERGVLPEGAEQVENDFGKKGYSGPCPPPGTHRYVFTLYALDVEHLEDVNRGNFFQVVEKHSIGKAESTGLYART